MSTRILNPNPSLRSAVDNSVSRGCRTNYNNDNAVQVSVMYVTYVVRLGGL